MSERATRWVGRYAVVAAIIAMLVAPLLALSWFATDGGAEALDGRTVAAWAVPARDALDGLLTWASPDRVYATYLQVFALLFPAVFLCARAVRARGPDAGRGEAWGWRVALVGYGIAAGGLLVGFVVVLFGPRADVALNVVYLAALLPGTFLSVIGSSWLGIALLRHRFTPAATAWLLTLALPSMLVLPEVLGHNSLGMVPLVVAWGVAGARLWRTADAATPAVLPTAAHLADRTKG
jgi:hypothetical protein